MAATLSRRVDMAEKWPDAVTVEEYKGYQIAIVPDADGSNPREWSNAGTFALWRSDYCSPDENAHNWRCADDFREWLAERKQERHSADPGVVYVWVGSWDRQGGLYTMGSDDDDRNYDGVIFATYEDIRKEWRKGKITDPAKRANVIECLKGEVKTYSLWATGEVYGYVVGDAEDDHIDSCWGFISWEPDGDDYALEQGKEAVDGLIADGRLPVIAEQDDAEDIDEY